MRRGLAVGFVSQLFSAGVSGVSSFTPNAMIWCVPTWKVCSWVPRIYQEPMFIWILSGFLLGFSPISALKGDRRGQETLFYELFRKSSVTPTLSIIHFYSLSQFHRMQYEHTWVVTSELTQINKCTQQWWQTAIIPVLGRPKEKDGEFKDSLKCLVRLCQAQPNKNAVKETCHLQPILSFQNLLGSSSHWRSYHPMAQFLLVLSMLSLWFYIVYFIILKQVISNIQ